MTYINTAHILFVLPENYFVVFLSANNRLPIIFLAHHHRQFIVSSPLYPLLHHAARCDDPGKSPLYYTAKLTNQAGVGCTIQSGRLLTKLNIPPDFWMLTAKSKSSIFVENPGRSVRNTLFT